MPVDLIALAGVITAPTVAGLVAVTIHRQRLTHEREEGDLRQLREILAKASGASYGFVVELQHMHAERAHPDSQIAAIGDARRRQRDFFETLLQLRLLFEPGHPLLEHSEALVKRFDSIVAPRWDEDPRAWGEPDLKPLQDAIDAWYSEARSVARARLA
jgi:hypothetical protein